MGWADVVAEVAKRLNVDPASVKLKYLDDEQEWMLLSTDQVKLVLRSFFSVSSLSNGRGITVVCLSFPIDTESSRLVWVLMDLDPVSALSFALQQSD